MMTSILTDYRPRVADMVWLTVAKMQRAAGPDADFAIREVINEVLRDFPEARRETVETYVSNHLIATANPSPDTYRMLHRTRRGHVRLHREGDPVHPGREFGDKTARRSTASEASRELIDWFDVEGANEEVDTEDPLERFAELMRASFDWKSVDPDEYVRQLREGWD